MDENTKISDLTVAEFRLLFRQFISDYNGQKQNNSVAMGLPDYKRSQNDLYSPHHDNPVFGVDRWGEKPLDNP